MLIAGISIWVWIAILGGVYVAYRFVAGKKSPSVLPATVSVGTGVSQTNVNSKLVEPEYLKGMGVAVAIEQKPVVSLVQRWADLRDEAAKNGAEDAVKKLDELFPLLHKTRQTVTIAGA